MKPVLAELSRHPALWRGGESRAGCASPGGLRELDDWLPGGGWPVGALTELVCEHHGIGELGLLVPLLAHLAAAGRRVVLVAPPFVPYAPALAARGVALETLLVVTVEDVAARFWAAEQALRSGVCGAVLLWLPASGAGAVLRDGHRLRRLQLAAERGAASGFVFRSLPAARTPVALCLRLVPLCSGARTARSGTSAGRLSLTVLKCRGRAPHAPLVLALP